MVNVGPFLEATAKSGKVVTYQEVIAACPPLLLSPKRVNLGGCYLSAPVKARP